MDNKIIPIAFVTDDNYAPYTGVAIISLFENKTKDTNIKLYIVDANISNENKNKLNNISIKYKFKIYYLKIDKKNFVGLKDRMHISKAAYYRLILPEIIEENKFIYLDCDILVLKDLSELLTVDISNYPIAGVRNRDKDFWGKKYNTNLYINTGVLLFNSDKWSNNNLSKRTIEYAKNNDLHYLDQDAINIICKNNILELNKKYNHYCHNNLFNKKNKNSAILHFAGNVKPWHYVYTGLYKKLYKKYLKLSPWYNKCYYDNNLKNFFLKYLKKTLFIIKYYIKLLTPKPIMNYKRKIFKN